MSINEIFYDRDQVTRFYNLFFKDKFHQDSVFMTFGLQRNKWNEYDIIFKDNIVNRRIIKKNCVDSFLETISRYNSDFNCYNIPLDCVGIYATLNPRSAFKAYNHFKNIVDKLISDTVYGKDKIVDWNDSGITNIESMLKTSIQSSCFKKTHLLIDLDYKEYFENVKDFFNEINVVPYCIIETRGGFHFVLNNLELTGEQKKRIFAQDSILSKLEKSQDKNGKSIMKKIVDIIGNNPMSPIPGTVQGGFKVKFVD
jgi:hypothetical protein